MEWTIEGLAEFWSHGTVNRSEKEIEAVIRLACRAAVKKAAEICETDGLTGIRLGGEIRKKLLGEGDGEVRREAPIERHAFFDDGGGDFCRVDQGRGDERYQPCGQPRSAAVHGEGK